MMLQIFLKNSLSRNSGTPTLIGNVKSYQESDGELVVTCEREITLWSKEPYEERYPLEIVQSYHVL